MRKWNSDAVLRLFSAVSGLLTLLLSPAPAAADGCFVAPPFVWDKYKDITEPTQKAIMVYANGREDLILQVKYNGPVEQFGWLIPVPALPTVQKGSMDCFYELSRFTQERWEQSAPAAVTAGLGKDDSASRPEPVKVIEIKTVGAYEVAVLSARDANSLENWLAANQFSFPKGKEDVIDSYVKQQWYFVAVKIDLGKTGFRLSTMLPGRSSGKSAVAEKLASGELQPLQISFAAGQCVFPLKISSINGMPSEVQVYVLSPEPLAERSLFDEMLPGVHRQTLERHQRWLDSRQRLSRTAQALRQQTQPGQEGLLPAVEAGSTTNGMMRMSVPYDALLPYAAVTAKELPKCAKRMPRLAQGVWWLTKRTWTFRPEEMKDLVFEPAAEVFASNLGGEEGYFAAENLGGLGSNAVPALLTALRSTNASIRIHAASIVEQFHDEQVTDFLPALFKDSEAEVRLDAAEAARNNPSAKLADPLLLLLRDKDEAVRRAAVLALRRYCYGRPDFATTLKQLMREDDLEVRACALELIRISSSDVAIPREQVLPLLAVPNLRTVSVALGWLERNGLACEDLVPVLQNPLAFARLAGLSMLKGMGRFQCVGLVLPLLNDPDKRVQARASAVFRQWTDQQYSSETAAAAAQWWATNKSNFLLTRFNQAVQDHPHNGSVYHQRGCYLYDTRQFSEALGDFQKAVQLGSDERDYSSFRAWLLEARLGKVDAATQALAGYLAHRNSGSPDDWQSKIGGFLTGKLTEADFISAAASTNLKVDREQHCEAWFYAGTRRLIEGDKTTASDYFGKCLATGIAYFEEYQSAEAELKAMSGPAE